MAELNEIMSDKKAGTYKKDFFNVASYIEKFYDAEEYLFNFEANDLVETRSGANDYVEEHTPHVLQHIAPEISWAINKISEATKEKKGITPSSPSAESYCDQKSALPSLSLPSAPCC